MAAAVETAFDIAFWFSDVAAKNNEYLQPQKLQRLLFLAQAYFGVAYGGKMLMPAIFVAEEMGPVEPNVYKAFTRGRPNLDVDMFLPEDAEQFLDRFWRRFGHHSADHLRRICKKNESYKKAWKKGRRTEIPFADMITSFVKPDEGPSGTMFKQPKIFRTQDGKPVMVKQWVPGTKGGDEE